MSVVVYHNGVMASDSRAYSGDNHPIGTKRKIHRIEGGPFDGSLVGICSGVPGMAEEFRRWIERGGRREDDLVPNQPDFAALLVTREGDVYLYCDAYYCSGPLQGNTFTIGSGKKYALGAIQMGADALQAVQATIDLDPLCGGPVAALELNPQGN